MANKINQDTIQDWYTRMNEWLAIHTWPVQTTHTIMHERHTWDLIHYTGIWKEAYAAGFNDNHIRTAFKKIFPNVKW